MSSGELQERLIALRDRLESRADRDLLADAVNALEPHGVEQELRDERDHWKALAQLRGKRIKRLGEMIGGRSHFRSQESDDGA